MVHCAMLTSFRRLAPVVHTAPVTMLASRSRLAFAVASSSFLAYSSVQCTSGNQSEKHGKPEKRAKHWSGVERGEPFTFEIEFDASFAKRLITVQAKRSLEGYVCSNHHGWDWSAHGESADSEYHAKKSARKRLNGG